MIMKWASEPVSFAEMHARLGGIPLERIRAKPAPGTATEADLEVAGKPTCELIDGVLVEKAMGNRESAIGADVLRQIGNHIRPDDLGVLLGEAGHIRVLPGQLRAPDVTYIPWTAFVGGEPPAEAYWSVAPGLVVEVISPSNTEAEIDRKLSELFGIGCKLAWVIDPATKTARVHTTATKFKPLDETGELDGGKVLPGFRLPLADLFAVGRRRKKKPR